MYTYSFNSINRIKTQYKVDIQELCKEYTYKIYFEKNFKRICYFFRISKCSYQYQECYDACTTAYLYSLCHCAVRPKRSDEGYIMAYVRKVMRIYTIAALTIYNDASNLCKMNGFQRINSDNYQV